MPRQYAWSERAVKSERESAEYTYRERIRRAAPALQPWSLDLVASRGRVFRGGVYPSHAGRDGACLAVLAGGADPPRREPSLRGPRLGASLLT